ncbi:arylsulfatase I-like [Pomacea canaliculata]|nr:arylsulfatase I-like [Pomacea canaliculata]
MYGGSNWPLRGAKHTLWEGGTRGKGFVFSKNLFKKTGTVYNGLMHIVDWFPTLMTLVKGETPPGMDGVSQWESIVNNEASRRKEFVYNIDEISQHAAIRVGDWKLIQGSPGNYTGWYPPPSVGSAVHEANYTESGPNTFRLYNLKDDPYEQKDLVTKKPDVLEMMKTRLEEWRKNLVPANYPANDPTC